MGSWDYKMNPMIAIAMNNRLQLIKSWSTLRLVGSWMADCLSTGKPSRCITNTMANSAFHPFVVGKLSRNQGDTHKQLQRPFKI